MSYKHEMTRRQFLRTGALVAPVVTFLSPTSLLASFGSDPEFKGLGDTIVIDQLPSRTINVPENVPVGYCYMVKNSDADPIQICAENITTLIADADGTPATAQSVDLQPGGICTVLKHRDGHWYVWGFGLEGKEGLRP